MSTTEELIEATVNKDGTATVNILGTTHEFTADSESAARVETVELVSKHAKQRGAVVRAVMHDDQGSWPVVCDQIKVGHFSTKSRPYQRPNLGHFSDRNRACTRTGFLIADDHTPEAKTPLDARRHASALHRQDTVES